MKKIIALLIFILSFTNTNAFAQSLYYELPSVNVNEYTINLSIFNNQKSNFDNFVAGDELKKYNIKSIVYNNNIGQKISSLAKWEDNNYVIQDGVQYVNVVVKVPLHDDMLVNVQISGIQNTAEVTNKEESITETTSKASLTATTLALTSDTSYDINISNKDSGASYTWTSNNEKVAIVNSKGMVSAISDGDAIITCTETCSDGTINTYTSTVTVGTDDNFPILNDDDITLDVKDTYKLKVENETSGSIIKYKSSDKTIAKVSVGGKITALKAGNCIITATITNGTNVVVLNCDVEVDE